MKIKKSVAKRLLREAFYEVLAEQELKTSSREILGKFPTLKRQLIALFTEEYDEFIGDIKWVAPKPSTFQIILSNNEMFFLKWNGKAFDAEISGKNYSLNYVADFQQAMDKLTELFKNGPVKSMADLEAEQEPEDEFADAGFGGGAGGGSEIGAGDLGGEFGGEEFEEPGEGGGEEGGEEIEFEEPGEEPV